MFDKLIARTAQLLERRAGIHLSRVIERPTAGNPPPTAVPGLRCSRLTQTQLGRWSRRADLELGAPQIRAAFSRGDVCIGAFLEGRLVAYQWLAFDPAPHVAGLWVEFGEGDCYVYKKLVLPGYRGRRIGEALNAYANRIAAQLGARRMVALIDLSNRASWQSSRRSGSRTFGYAGYVRWLERAIPFCSAGARSGGVQLRAAPPLARGAMAKAA